MGGKSSKGCGCLPWRKSRKVSPMPLGNGLDQRADGTSSEILKELNIAGFFTTVKKPGGVRVIMKREHINCSSKTLPRRLPSISKAAKPTGGQVVYDKEDKNLMVEIRRLDALKEKGKMARLHDDRRRKVLARKNNQIKEKIRRTEAKLKKGPTQLLKTKPQGKEQVDKDETE